MRLIGELGIWRSDIGIPKQSCSHLFPLYLSLGWRGGAGGEVSGIRTFKNFYLLYSGVPTRE